MKYVVTGANRETGEEVRLTLEAISPDHAEQQAIAAGLLVSDVRGTSGQNRILLFFGVALVSIVATVAVLGIWLVLRQPQDTTSHAVSVEVGDTGTTEEPGAKPASKRELRRAVEASRMWVEDRLIAPATAEWEGTEDAMDRTIKWDEGHYQVRSWVDAQNRMGVPIRMPYVANMERLSDGTWKLLDLCLGDEEVAALDNAIAGLTMLSLADEFKSPHDKAIWVMASTMAHDGYVYTGSDQPVMQTIEDLSRATAGWSHLSPGTTTDYETDWRLRRVGDSDEDVGSLLHMRNPYEPCDEDFELAVCNEWQAKSRLPSEVTQAGSYLIFCACHWARETRAGAANPSRAFNDKNDIKIANQIDWREQDIDHLHLEMHQAVGDYVFQAIINDRGYEGLDGAMCDIVIWFTYLGVG